MKSEEQDTIKHWKKTCNENWEETWRQNAPEHFKEKKPLFFTTSVTETLRRKQQRVINRVIIGHTNLTHVHLMKNERPKMCQECNTRLTMDHLLAYCQSYQAQRIENNIPRNQETKKVINFLKDTNLYDSM